MSSSSDLIALARSYLAALERGAPFDELLQYFDPECVQEEFPNRFTPNGARRNLDDLRAAAARGKKAVAEERYEVLGAVTQDDVVALEVQGSARLLVGFGTLEAGHTMRARFAVFLTYRGGRILRRHNYDCFEPF